MDQCKLLHGQTIEFTKLFEHSFFSRYELCTNLFDAIVQELSHHEKTQRGIKATLRKQESGKMWNRLISSSLSTSWLTKDFDHTWFDSDDEDAVLIHRTEPWVDPSKFMIHLYLLQYKNIACIRIF